MADYFYPVANIGLAQLARGAYTGFGVRGLASAIPWFYRGVHKLPAPNSLYQRRITTGVYSSDADAPNDVDSLPELAWGIDGTADDNGYPLPPHEAPSEAPIGPKPGFDWTLNPFSLLFRGIAIPVFGTIDIAIQKAKAVVVTYVSLFYHSLPLTNIGRLSRLSRIIKRTDAFGGQLPWILSPDGEVCVFCQAPRHTSLNFGRSRTRRLYPCTCFEGTQLEYGLTVGSRFTTFSHRLDSFPVFPDIEILGGSNDRLQVISQVYAFPIQHCDHDPNFDNHVAPTFHYPSPTADGLYRLRPGDVWRSNERSGGVRCVHHYQNELHSWHPWIINLMKKGASSVKQVNPQHYLAIKQLLQIFYLIQVWCNDNLIANLTYSLVSVTSTRLDSFQFPQTVPNCIAIVDSQEVAQNLSARWDGSTGGIFRVICLPMVHHLTSFAGWRVVFALCCLVDVRLLICNQNISNYQAIGRRLLLQFDYAWSSIEIGHCWPFYMGCALVKTRHVYPDMLELATSFFYFGDCYGWDELYPALKFVCSVLVFKAPGLPNIMAPLVHNALRRVVITNFILINKSRKILGVYTADFNRSNIGVMSRLMAPVTDVDELGFWHVFADPRATDLTHDIATYTEIEYDTPAYHDLVLNPSFKTGENALSELAQLTGGVVLYTFGSRGDRSPLQCLGRFMQRHGVQVYVIHLNTIDESRTLLDATGLLDDERAQLFHRARLDVQTIDARHSWVPAPLMLMGVTSYSLAPPDDVIYPVRASDNVLIALCYSIIGLVNAPSFNIGGYARPFFLPTSHDGQSFMSYSPNQAPSGAIGAWWGSSGQVIEGYEHVPLIPPGDHAQTFPNYETIYCHGGAGTVALGSASGCRVVSCTDTLDRAYRNPDDAGNGVAIGTDPDAVFLALAGHNLGYFGYWARSNWFRPDKLIAWTGFNGIFNGLFRIGMLYLLYTRAQKPSMVTGSPMATLGMLMFGISRPSLPMYISAFVIAALVDRLLVAFGRDYYWVGAKFIRINYSMIMSIPAFWAAQRYSLVVGYCVSACLPGFTEFIASAINWTVDSAVGFRQVSNASTFHVELSTRIHGIPVIHVALYNFTTRQRYEAVRSEDGLYGYRLFERCGPQGGIYLPTSLTIRDINQFPTIERRYGIFWNCQTALFLVAGPYRCKIGLGLLPAAITVAVVTPFAWLATICAITLYGVTLLVPSMFGTTFTRHGLLRIGGDVVSSAFDVIGSEGVFLGPLSWAAQLLPFPWQH
jgi:hypothetical protein